jgi:hypothetical protein
MKTSPAGKAAGLAHDPEIGAIFGKDHTKNQKVPPLRAREDARRCSLPSIGVSRSGQTVIWRI